MFIFRYEHNRKICADVRFMEGSNSLTGHGTYTMCPNRGVRPNFGLAGSPPYSIMQHERCAVTANQFYSWIAPDMWCRYETSSCYGAEYCYDCSIPDRVLNVPDNWDLIAYWVDDNANDIDWRVENDQIVFNPEFAINMGVIDPSEVDELRVDSWTSIY